MAKEVAVGKRAKISQAQQYMLLSVIGASVFLGVAISLVLYFVKVISFNANVIAEQEKSIVSYSNAIRDIGICTRPKGTIYSDKELKDCNPSNIDVSSISGTLRANILENIAANQALNSVPNEGNSECVNPINGKNYTYAEMMNMYNTAENNEALIIASSLIRNCSALRIIPDALPAFRNEEALLASLNKIFDISGILPESLSPSGTSEVVSFDEKIEAISVRLSVESNTASTIKFLDNVERSIRDFSIENATIEWGSDDTLILQARSSAFYTSPSTLEETKVVVEGDEE